MHDENYSREFEDEDIYDMHKRQQKELSKSVRIPKEPEERPEKDVVEKGFPVMQAIPHGEPEKIKSLNRLKPEVIGGLFEKVEFLRERLKETEDMISLRKGMHEEIIKEIEADIKEKQEIEMRLADIMEKRNFKLDISILRREKRTEKLQFWRDVLELRTEMRELLEQYEMERKLTGIFADIKGERQIQN
ncbi:MAG: hypothetical protein HYX24_06565 [Candidatus Aenigmarchaeota archaeon]|nr:hypothetical protein [Candidatus Aenigmarchaeota archaeon]